MCIRDSVKVRSCPVKEEVNREIVILDVVAFSSLMIRTSAGVMLVTAGSSLTFMLAISCGITSVIFRLSNYSVLDDYGCPEGYQTVPAQRNW